MSIKQLFTPSKLIRTVIIIVGLVGSLITVYAFLFPESRNALQYDIVADTSVLDIRADVGNLEILYGKSNLKENKENLRIISVRVVNTGNVNIIKNFYDDEDLLGIRITDGKIIETPELLQCSNEYLRRNLKIALPSPDSIRFSKVIMEPNEYFTIKLLVLHKINLSPRIVPIGKIAGVKSIKVVNVIESKATRPFFTEVFSGGSLVQVVRLFLYSLAALI